MTIAAGQALPDVPVRLMKDGAPSVASSQELLGSGRVVLFAVPGAFTPGCSRVHLPGFKNHAQELSDKGVDTIACISVNDVFVMDAWGDVQGVNGQIVMIADPDAAFAKAVGMDLDATDKGLGVRSQRYAMVIDDGVVTEVFPEADGLSVDASTAECVLAKL